MTTILHVAHYEVVCITSYGILFEVIWYDVNNQLVPLVFYHSVAPELYAPWKVFSKRLQILMASMCGTEPPSCINKLLSTVHSLMFLPMRSYF